MDEHRGSHWVRSWATTPDPLEQTTLSGQTVRNIAYVSLGGRQVRVLLSNAYGTGDLTIGSAAIGLRAEGADLVPDTARSLTFGGARSAVVAAGALVVSDPVDLAVPDLAELVVSVFLPQDLANDFRLTGHDGGHQTNYVSPRGDFTGQSAFPVERSIESFMFVSAIDVATTAPGCCIVAFGDSLTEGNLSTKDANQRWPDQLARRLTARSGSTPASVVNQGIGGNRLLHDGRGDSGARRFDRDAIATPGATHVIVALGINDLRNSARRADQEVDVAGMVAGYRQLVVRARMHGHKVFGATLMPWKDETFSHLYTADGERKRQAINAWIREGGAFDAVIDFDAMLRDPDQPDRLLPRFDCGDHLHPSDAGYTAMGDGIDLALFD